MKSLRAGDAGVAIDLTVKSHGGLVDISAATTLEMVFVSPTGLVTTQTAALHSNGQDGRLEYLTQPTDFLELGMWGVQAHVVLPGSPNLDVISAMETFRVERAL